MAGETAGETAGYEARSPVGRRRAIKGIAAGSAAAIVWAEPTIKGLARRPAFASAGSVLLELTFDGTFEVPAPLPPEGAVLATNGPPGQQVDLVIAQVGANFFLRAAPVIPDSCICTIEFGDLAELTNIAGDSTVEGVFDGIAVTFSGLAGDPARLTAESIFVACTGNILIG